MAVYTKLSKEEVKSIVNQYDIGSLIKAEGIKKGIENTNYFIETTKDKYILTIFEKRVRQEELPFFVSLMRHFSNNGISCPVVIGNRLGNFHGKAYALISFVEGEEIEDISPSHLYKLGGFLAKMHKAGEGFKLYRKNDYSVKKWCALLKSINPEKIEKGLKAEIVSELEYIKENWPSALPEGIIHADLFPDNVFFIRDDISAVIDFYFACNDFLAYDIAICIVSWCFDGGVLNNKKQEALLEGYNKIRKLSDAELAALPVLARGAAMRFLLTRCYDFLNTPKVAEVNVKEPQEYLDILRNLKAESHKTNAQTEYHLPFRQGIQDLD